MTYRQREKLQQWLWLIPGLFLLSVIVSALGSTTTHYQCKYVESVKVEVADHEKFADGAYTVHYSDGTTGAMNTLGRSGAPLGLSKGTVCKTVLMWGWPYSGTNRNVIDQSQVK